MDDGSIQANHAEVLGRAFAKAYGDALLPTVPSSVYRSPSQYAQLIADAAAAFAAAPKTGLESRMVEFWLNAANGHFAQRVKTIRNLSK